MIYILLFFFFSSFFFEYFLLLDQPSLLRKFILIHDYSNFFFLKFNNFCLLKRIDVDDFLRYRCKEKNLHYTLQYIRQLNLQAISLE